MKIKLPGLTQEQQRATISHGKKDAEVTIGDLLLRIIERQLIMEDQLDGLVSAPLAPSEAAEKKRKGKH